MVRGVSRRGDHPQRGSLRAHFVAVVQLLQLSSAHEAGEGVPPGGAVLEHRGHGQAPPRALVQDPLHAALVVVVPVSQHYVRQARRASDGEDEVEQLVAVLR